MSLNCSRRLSNRNLKLLIITDHNRILPNEKWQFSGGLTLTNAHTRSFCMIHFVVVQWKGIGNHGGNCESGGILSNRLSLPLPLTACHRCDVCGKLLSTKLTLKRHKEQQHLQPLNNAVCNLCHKVFRTLNSLNNHKSIYHRRQKHQLYSAHPPGQNLPPHHLTQLSQSNAAKLDFI